MQDIMQDRYKFKIWDKTEKKFLPLDSKTENTDSWISIDNTGVYLVERDNARDVAFFTDITEDVIILQCTGLKDKNDKLIYEGDIVKYFCPAEYCSDGLHKCPECYSGENGSVHYDEDLAMYEYRSKSDECPLTDNINTEEDLEIIGNIYENPELLEVGILA